MAYPPTSNLPLYVRYCTTNSIDIGDNYFPGDHFSTVTLDFATSIAAISGFQAMYISMMLISAS